MQALVTGASGFVGAALCRALVAAGHQVRALTRSVAAGRARVGAGSELEWIEGSVADPRQVAEAAQGCEVLLHAAGLPPVAAPARVLRWLHVAGSENVLRAAKRAKIERLVHISCADVSLTHEDRMHWDEQRVLPHDPVGLFAQTKLMAEELLLAAADDDLQVIALRPARLWGPDDVDGIARFAGALERGSLRLFDGGRNIIATTHIDNLMRAALAASAPNTAPARAYYITDGEFLEAREWFGRYAGALGLPAPRAGSFAVASLQAKLAGALGDQGAALTALLRDGRSALFDVSKAVHDLGYEPHIELEARLAELASWVQAQGGLAAVRTRARPLPVASDVDGQVALAGGD
jgi:nucleoside-diphosphate-sugar epimerase